ncbi:MAG TPA: hypothetical protein VFK79_00550 [Xanthobacteraceae bacterium]|nr:hypothetical protein [Xanthobacteraceae bacterium]
MAAEPEEETISERLRGLSFVLAAAYATLGAVLFFMPGWAAGRFAWNVSPFVAMTIGGWCLGNAWACFVVGRRGTWPALVCPILYLALFGLFESAVLVAFRERLLIGQPLAWLYCVTLAATCVFAVMAAFEAMGRRRILIAVGQPLGSIGVGFVLLFILLVGFLGLYGLLAVAGMRGLNGGIFPEQLSPFSLRGFRSFLSLARPGRYSDAPRPRDRQSRQPWICVVWAARLHNRSGVCFH